MNFIKDARNQYTVVINNKSYQFDSTHPEFTGLVECIRVGDEQEFDRLLNVGTVIEDWSEGSFKFADGVLHYDVDGETEVIHDVITDRIVEMIKGGFNVKPMLNFLEKLYMNPSYRAINELYTFLQHKFLPITPDGYFLAYKAVRPDFMDKYSGKFDNSVGNHVRISRRRVDDNCEQGCSYGLHVGAIDYVKSYGASGDKVVICKVHPADVVSVPLDSEHQKVRCCGYEVVGEYDGDLIPAVVDDYYDEEEECDDPDCWCHEMNIMKSKDIIV
jgi:hypothetical protein